MILTIEPPLAGPPSLADYISHVRGIFEASWMFGEYQITEIRVDMRRGGLAAYEELQRVLGPIVVALPPTLKRSFFRF